MAVHGGEWILSSDDPVLVQALAESRLDLGERSQFAIGAVDVAGSQTDRNPRIPLVVEGTRRGTAKVDGDDFWSQAAAGQGGAGVRADEGCAAGRAGHRNA